ncbi:S8 family serine peptidase [Flavobacterium phycosphaerae]|uniref:S8 family serine peptidase n=1 Tax=Flavobacterium phycosphaerae TaxID=2697515 RepID=UPI00138973A0|nr:S8 family serine peptidase [Flavobacterium phycosphaerae]
MKKIFFIAFLFTSLLSFSQEDAWVYFTDKPNAQFYFDNPLEMLSQRALDRRANQNIELDNKDVPLHQPYVDAVIAVDGIVVKAKSKWFNALHVRGSIANIQSLTDLAFVDHIQFADKSLNGTNRMANSKKKVLGKVNKNLDVNTTFAYGNSANQIQMLNAHLLHQQNFTGAGKIIAVLDAGFPNVDTATPFQRLHDNNLILGGYNFVDGDTNFYSRGAHGTMVLSTMGGYVPNQLVGTAPDAQYYLFITEDTAAENPVEESYWVEAAELADSLGVDVITTSLGYFQYDDPSYSYTYEDMNGNTSFISKGADIAFSRGMICVVSAGNSGAGPNPNIAVPADALNVLTVGAVKSDRTYAAFSSIGPSFDGRIKPDVMAQGESAVLSNMSGTIATGSGTSFSCPILAGAIASFWQAVPWATNAQITDFVKQSADGFSFPTYQYGYGIPDFQLALDTALSVTDTAKGQFLVYPNPAYDKLFVSFPADSDQANVSFYNALGQLVLQKSIEYSNAAISLEALTSGIYFYKIKCNSLVQSGKIIKN